MLGSGAGGEGGGGTIFYPGRPAAGGTILVTDGHTPNAEHQHHRPPPALPQNSRRAPAMASLLDEFAEAGGGAGPGFGEARGGPAGHERGGVSGERGGAHGACPPTPPRAPTVRGALAANPRPFPSGRSGSAWRPGGVHGGGLRPLRPAPGPPHPTPPPHSPTNPPKSAPRPAPGRRRASRPGPRSRGRRRRRRRRRARANREGQPPPPLPPAPPPPPTDSDLRAARCIALTRRRPVVQPTRSRSAPPAFVETAFGPSGVASGGGRGETGAEAGPERPRQGWSGSVEAPPPPFFPTSRVWAW